MENNDNDILNRAVDELKNRTVNRDVPDDVLKKTASLLKASQTQGASMFRRLFQPSLAAAIVLIAASAAIYFVLEKFDAGSVAWAEVKNCLRQTNFAHCYSAQESDTEAWYIDGVIYFRDNDRITKDDGKAKFTYDLSGNLLHEKASDIGDTIIHEGTALFDIVTQGVFEYDSNDILRKAPVYVSEDLLIYKFDAPKSMRDWASGLTITAGRQSKLPVYIKIASKNPSRRADIYIFDYEPQELPDAIKQISAKQPENIK